MDDGGGMMGWRMVGRGWGGGWWVEDDDGEDGGWMMGWGG